MTDLAALMGRRAGATGTALASVGVPFSFQRTFMTRSTVDQALVTGLGYAITQALATTIQEGIQSAALALAGGATGETEPPEERWSRAAIAVDLAAVAAGVGVQRLLQQRPDEPLTRASGRTAGQVLALTGLGGAVVGSLQHLTGLRRGWRARVVFAAATGAVSAQREWYRRRSEQALVEQGIEPSEISGARALALGGGVAVGASLIAAVEGRIADLVADTVGRIVPGGRLFARPLGHTAALGLLLAGARGGAQRVFHMIEGREFAVEPAIDIAPLFPEVSGGPDSLVDFRTLAKQGRRFVWTLRNADIIEQVTGERAVAMPIRVYVGLNSAPTEQERVALAIAELERTGAFDRRWLVITQPTGTGYCNYAAAGAMELLSLGDCANVAMQYAARPSPMSLDRISEGRQQARMLVDAVAQALAPRPADERPTVLLFGESLGAWSSQDAFLDQGTQGLADAGIDHALWIGTPMESKWKEQVLHDDRPDVDRSLVGMFNDIGQWRALPAEEREQIRFVMVSHNNDGVAWFGAALAVQSPWWLQEEPRPPGVPASQRWIPVTSFVQGLVDMKNAARVEPGVFEADGHDYRADVVPFLNALLGFDAAPERLAAIVRALETEESRRTRWIAARGKVGESMAAVILDKLREQDPDAFTDALRAVERDFIAEVEPQGGG